MVFTSGVYRLILLVLIPLAVIGLQAGVAVLTRSALGNEKGVGEMAAVADAVMCVAAIIVTQAEIIMDEWAFGSIAIKGGISLEYLKTSQRGRQVIQKALKIDLIRKLLECAMILFLGRLTWVVTAGGGKEFLGPGRLGLMLSVLFCQYFVIEIALLVSRRYGSFQVNMAAAIIAYIVLAFLIVMCRWSYFVTLAVAGLTVAVSMQEQRRVMRRVEESYYDQRP